MHNDICGSHINGYLLVKKIMTIGYFWLTMEYDCVDFATKYIKYQMHGDVVCAPFTKLHSMTALWPCSMWIMNVIRAINPSISIGYQFILVTIEYFTKWVETIFYKHVTKKVVTDFLRNNGTVG